MDKGYGNLAASIGPIMKPFTSTILIIFHPLKGSMPIKTFRIFRLPMPFMVGKFVNNHMSSCKSLDKPVRQTRKPSEGFELKHSYHAQETY